MNKWMDGDDSKDWKIREYCQEKRLIIMIDGNIFLNPESKKEMCNK